MAYINLENNKIYYATNRKSWKTESGLQLVFIHGAGGDHRVWIYQIEHFRTKYSYYALDLPGHGFSKGDGLTAIDAYAHFVSKFIVTLGLKESILIGHSMGGAIAQIMALKYSTHIKGTVLVGTGARLKVSPFFLEKFKNINSETAELFCKYAFAQNTANEIILKATEMILHTPSEVFHNDFIACNNFDSMDELKHIHLPALIIGASHDQLTPLKYSKYLHEQITFSQLITVENAGHMMMLENPMVVNQTIDKWLEELKSEVGR